MLNPGYSSCESFSHIHSFIPHFTIDKRLFVAIRWTGSLLGVLGVFLECCFNNRMSACLKVESGTVLSKCVFRVTHCLALGHGRMQSSLLQCVSRRRLSTLLNDISTVFEAGVSFTAFT